MSTMREQFEAAAKQKGFFTNRVGPECDYTYADVRAAWWAWQAATEAAKATGTAGEQTKQSFEKIEELKLPTHLVNLQRYAPVVLMDGTMPTMKADNSGTWLNAYNVAEACAQDAGRTNQLPPLPESLNDVKAMMRGEPEWLESCDDYYTQHQMREYGRACAEAARQPAPVLSDAQIIEIYLHSFNSMPGALRQARPPEGSMKDTIVAFARAILAATNRSEP